ncbi:MAG: cob(I)yrinic acid a,c-diamide adenosyltransferase [Bacillota bacterium]|nr:cob(I)yrinic acid a,c-diamide adenosyltransferase [Bacillota bacterium]
MDKGQRGLLMVYSGQGKGKTTAALGLALRAVGHGKKVLMIQFMKGDPNYGEIKAAKFLPGFEIVQQGQPSFVDQSNPGAEDLRLAQEGLRLAGRALAQGDQDLIVLDELNVAVEYGLVSPDEMLATLERRRPEVDVVVTGRGAHPELVKRADMVSEILDIKHHFHEGVTARAGIEY